MFSLGYKAGPEQYGPNELLEYTIAADEVGFDSVDVSDHFHPWSEEGQACFTWTWLGALAVKTKRISMGPGVTCPILRYHPAIIAQAIATVDVMSDGRAYLAVGTGEALNEYAATGLWPEYPERQEMLAEAIALMRELWKGEDVTFEGDYYQTRKARLYTPPNRQIPIYISSLVPESAEFAGEFGDGLMTVGGQKPEVYKKQLKNFAAGAKKVKKDPAKMPKLIELNAAYTDDKEAVIAQMQKYWAGTFIPALFNQKIYTPAMSAQNGEAVGADAIAQKMCISAKASDHVKFAKQYIDLGFTHLFFHSAGPNELDFVTRYGKEVLPQIRKTANSA
jgi:coenzyme F420-dependent glucose-6-phosphate dehydrogenase